MRQKGNYKQKKKKTQLNFVKLSYFCALVVVSWLTRGCGVWCMPHLLCVRGVGGVWVGIA